MQLESMYQEIILDHYRHPHGRGLREPYDGESHQVNPTCGDEVTLRVRVSRADGADGEPRIEDVSYEGMGCSISQASESVLHDLVVGKSVSEARAVTEAFRALMNSKGEGGADEEILEDAVAFAGVSKYPARIKCALLGWMAFTDAVGNATGRVADRAGAAGQPTGQGG